MTFEALRRMALAMPGVAEGLSYGTPSFRVQGKLFARLREDGGTLVLRMDFDEREALIAADPATFFVTDHYRSYEWILVRLARIGEADLQRLLEGAWRRRASRRLVGLLGHLERKG